MFTHWLVVTAEQSDKIEQLVKEHDQELFDSLCEELDIVPAQLTKCIELRRLHG